MRYSKNKDFNNYVAGLIKSGEWAFIPKGSTKHACIRHLASGVKCPVPGSPNSNPAGLQNFKTLTRRIARQTA